VTIHPALLLLADARFPSGAHAHSFGIEAAHGVGDVHDLASLGEYVHGRLHNLGVVEAAFAAATASRVRTALGPSPDDLSADSASTSLDPAIWVALDRELAARTLSPALTAASRTLGRQLLRAASRVWPNDTYASLRAASGPDGPLQPIALGTAGVAAGLSDVEIALCSLHHLVGGTTTAAVRLLGLDPFDVAALCASLTPMVHHLAEHCASFAHAQLDALPSVSSPLADVLAEHHATWEVRLFAS
jgi:urease accessory protein